MSDKFQPMLCAKIRTTKGPDILAKDRAMVRWPKFISTKIDGIRGWNPHGTGLLSRTMKVIPNRHVQARFGGPEFLGIDGELVHGTPYEDGGPVTVMQKAQSATSTYDGPEDVDLYVFDYYDEGEHPYEYRLKYLQDKWSGTPGIHIVEQRLVHSWEEAEEVYAEYLIQKFEGACLKDPGSFYETRRPPLSANINVKLKPWVDAEAIIVGFEELYSNQNEQTVDERGYSKRSSHQENQIPMDMLGAFICRSPKWEEDFKIGAGPGMTHEFRKHVWKHREEYLGGVITFSYNAMRTYKKPSLPQYRSIRPKWDFDPSEITA